MFTISYIFDKSMHVFKDEMCELGHKKPAKHICPRKYAKDAPAKQINK